VNKRTKKVLRRLDGNSVLIKNQNPYTLIASVDRTFLDMRKYTLLIVDCLPSTNGRLHRIREQYRMWTVPYIGTVPYTWTVPYPPKYEPSALIPLVVRGMRNQAHQKLLKNKGHKNLRGSVIKPTSTEARKNNCLFNN